MDTCSAKVFTRLTDAQHSVEKIWSQVLEGMSSGQKATSITIPSDMIIKLGEAGLHAIAQRCNTIQDSMVEVSLEKDGDTANLNISLGAVKPQNATPKTSTSITSNSQSTTRAKNGKPPRPPNAFILYRQHHHARTVAENPSMHNNQISKLIGSTWKQEPQSIRDDWKRKADRAKFEHRKQHPDYQYQPRRPSEKKRRMTKKKRAAIAGNTPPEPEACHNADHVTPQSTDQYETPAAIPVSNLDLKSAEGFGTFEFDPYEPDQLGSISDMLQRHLDEAVEVPEFSGLGGFIETYSHTSSGHGGRHDTRSMDLFNIQNTYQNAEDSLQQLLEKDIEAMAVQQALNSNTMRCSAAADRFTHLLTDAADPDWDMDAFLNDI